MSVAQFKQYILIAMALAVTATTFMRKDTSTEAKHELQFDFESRPSTFEDENASMDPVTKKSTKKRTSSRASSTVQTNKHQSVASSSSVDPATTAVSVAEEEINDFTEAFKFSMFPY